MVAMRPVFWLTNVSVASGAVLYEIQRAPIRLVVVVIASVALSACTPDTVTRSPAAPSLGPTVGVASPGVAVPGGVAVVVPPGSPQVCAALARSAAIRDLGQALADIADPQLATGAAQTLRQAATDLTVLADEQADAPLATAMQEASGALDQLAESPQIVTDPDAAAAPAAALSRLGEEVQRVCDLPVG